MKHVSPNLYHFVSAYIPEENRESFNSLFAECTTDELAVFVADRYEDELRFLFSWIPEWEPPSWKDFEKYGSPSTLPIYPRAALQLGLKEQHILRYTALEIIGQTSKPEVAVYKIMKWVFENIEWGPAWGVRLPSEIIDKKMGSCLHLAQLTAVLLRSLFLPCRLVECINLVPDSVIREEAMNWQDLPDVYQQWYGRNFWSHVFCEALANGEWIPIDPTNGEYGVTEALRHTRIPEYLKLLVRTFPDNEEPETLNRRYIQHPLNFERNQDAQKAEEYINRIEKSVSNSILTCRDAIVSLSSEAKWLQNYAFKKRVSILQKINFSKKTKDNIVEHHIKTAVNNLKEYKSMHVMFPSEANDILPENLMNDIQSGCFAALILAFESNEEEETARLLNRFGYHLGNRISIPGNDPIIRVLVKGIGCSETPVESDLNLPLTRKITGNGKEQMLVKSAVIDHDGNTLAIKLKLGLGCISFIPIALVGGASPTYYSLLASNHRRILSVMVN